MIPFKMIKIGDRFSDPARRNYGEYSGLIFEVIEKNEEEKLIRIQAHDFVSNEDYGSPFWKEGIGRMFSESWREKIFFKDKIKSKRTLVRNAYKDIIKKFDESINQAPLVKVKNVKVGKDFVTADIHLIAIDGKHVEERIYRRCKYIRSELDNGLIFNRTWKSRWNEF